MPRKGSLGSFVVLFAFILVKTHSKEQPGRRSSLRSRDYKLLDISIKDRKCPCSEKLT